MEASGGKFPGGEFGPYLSNEAAKDAEVIRVGVELAISNYEDFRDGLIGHMERTKGKVILDLRKTELDSAGLGALVRVNRRARELDGVELSLQIEGNTALLTILEMTGANSLFTIEPPEDGPETPPLIDP